MRILDLNELSFLEDNGEQQDGAIPIETTVQELADLKAGTCCGSIGNQAFNALANFGYNYRICKGWFDKKENVVLGMFHIQSDSEEDAECISTIVSEVHGSLRFNDKSKLPGFMEFEIE